MANQDYFDRGTKDIEQDVHDEFEAQRDRLEEAFVQIKNEIDNIEAQTGSEEKVENIVANLIVPGSDVDVSYDDGNDKLTISTSTSILNQEEVEDIVGNLVQSGTGVSTVNYDDNNDTLTFEVLESNISLADLGNNSHSDLADSPSDAHHTRYSNSEALTAVNNDSDHGTTANHDYFSGSHDDLSNVSVSDHRTDEQIQDLVASLASAGSNMTITYDDANNTLTFDSSDKQVNHIPGERMNLSSQSISGGEEITFTPDEQVSISITHTNYASGLSNEEIYRMDLQSGETFVLDRIEFQQKGGGSSSNASIDVYDATAGTVLESQTLGGVTKNSNNSGSGNTVLIRLNNATGSAIDVSLLVNGYIN
jgi:hypothetical protein